MYHPNDDGKTHINVYSKGKTALGRFLTNFATSKIVTEDGPFASIEGLWYWLGCKDDRLRKLSGFAAKKLGRELRAPDWGIGEDFQDKIRKATIDKLEAYPKYARQLAESSLPLTHYYVYGQKTVDVPEAAWILDFIDFLRTEYRKDLNV